LKGRKYRTGGVAEVVQPSEYKVLSSNPSTEKKFEKAENTDTQS
jgi:hypothetical protein